MKTKHLLFAAAILTGFAACTNEDIVSKAPMYDGKGELIQVGSDFVLSGAKSEDASTRAISADGKFSWMPKGNKNDGTLVPEAIGLCWTGVGPKSPIMTTGERVFTNYKFDHAGWFYTDAQAPFFDKCSPFALTEGEWLVANAKGGPIANQDAGTSVWTASGLRTLDFAKGMFNTKNTTIYSGEYIVYFPYNDKFFDDPVTATAPKQYYVDLATGANPYQAMSEHSFSVGYVADLTGGDQVNSFATRNFSGYAFIRFANSSNSAKVIKRIILHAKDGYFYEDAQLDASKIKGNAGKSLKGINLYNGAFSKSNTISIDLFDGEVNGKNIVAGLTVNAEMKFAVPVLPIDLEKMDVYLVSENNQVAKLPTLTNVSFQSDDYYQIKTNTISGKTCVDIKDLSFSTQYIVTDAASLEAAAASISALNSGTATIQVLEEVKLENDVTIAGKKGAVNVIVTGEKIIVPEEVTFTTGYTTMISSVDVLDSGCCNGEAPGTYKLYDGTTIDTKSIINSEGRIIAGGYTNYEVTGTEAYQNWERTGTGPFGIPIYGWVTRERDVYGDVQYPAEIVVSGTINNLKSDENPNDGSMIVNTMTQIDLFGKITNATEIFIHGNGKTAEDGTIRMKRGSDAAFENSGLIYNSGNIDNSVGLNALKNMTTSSVFVDKVGSTMSGYGFNNNVGGEFICEVNSYVRFNAAKDNSSDAIRPTTTIRFLSAPKDAAGTWANASYVLEGDLTNKLGDLINFEINTEPELGANNGGTIRFTDNSGEAAKFANLNVINCASLIINHKTLTVNGTMTTQQIVTVNNGLTVMKDVTVKSGGAVTFVNGTKVFVGGTAGGKVDGANFSVEKGGSVVFQKNNVSKIWGTIFNNGSIEIVNSVSGTDVAAKVYCEDRDNNDKNYTNNSYPIYF